MPATDSIPTHHSGSWPGLASLPCPPPPPTLENHSATAVADADLRLMERVVARDESAFAELLDRHAGLLTSVLTRLLGSAEEAEEVLQEVFLQVWERADRFRGDRSSPRGWMVVLARSRAVDRIRARSARRLREEAVHREQTRLEAPSESTVLVGLEERERNLRVRAALADVPLEQRQAVELAFFEGLTHREVAARLGLPLGTAKSRILLGMRKLKHLLAWGWSHS